jgi:hypothetical protein
VLTVMNERPSEFVAGVVLPDHAHAQVAPICTVSTHTHTSPV